MHGVKLINEAEWQRLQHVVAGRPREHARFDDRVSTGWPRVDHALGGGLIAGALHEWFGVSGDESDAVRATHPTRHPAGYSRASARRFWMPPLCVLAHMVRAVVDHDAAGRWMVWIGKRCFPYPATLAPPRETDRRLLKRSIFVTAEKPADRLWAMDLALRCPAVAAVAADGSGFDMAATRRVQLLSEKTGIMSLLIRPPWEMAELSAARTRWRVRWDPCQSESSEMSLNPRWSVELLRCKGVRPASTSCEWGLEWDHAQSALCLSSPMVRATGEAATAQADGESTGRTRRFA